MPKIKVGNHTALGMYKLSLTLYRAGTSKASHPHHHRLYCSRGYVLPNSDSGPTHHTTHQHLPSHPTVVMPPMEDGDNDDKCNLHHARPDFMPDARDIMNKFPRPDAAASTKIRAFRDTCGACSGKKTSSQRAAAQNIFFGLFIFSRFTPCRPRDERPSEHQAAPSTRRHTTSGSGRSSTPSRNLSMKW